jgi:hypothetical protein
VKYIFLRLYGANLERRAPNQSRQACSAAITQTILALIIPCSAIAAYAVSVAVPLDLESLLNFSKAAVVGMAVLLGLSTWGFKRYAEIPGAADKFRNRGSRKQLSRSRRAINQIALLQILQTISPVVFPQALLP